MLILAPFLAAVSSTQIALSISCRRLNRATTAPALLLIIVSPFQFLAAAFGESIFDALHRPSSFDSFGDIFDSLTRAWWCVVAAVAISAMLSVWLAVTVRSPRNSA